MHRITSALRQLVQLAEDLGLQLDVLGHRLDDHPGAGHRILQVAAGLDPPVPTAAARALRLSSICAAT